MATARAWRGFLDHAEPAPLQQAWAYGEAARGEAQIAARWSFRAGGETVAATQWIARRFNALAPVAFVLRGPVWRADARLDAAARAAILGALAAKLRARDPRAFVVIDPNAPVDRLAETLRRSKLYPILSGQTHATLALDDDERALRARLTGKWRNMLKRAEAEKLRLDWPKGGAHLDWLLALCDDQRRARGYKGPSGAFAKRVVAADPERATLAIALERTTPVAGALFVGAGRCASYFMGATTARGRALRAHHLLLWRSILRWRERGATWIDLGSIDTHAAPGIARFKLGLGATPTRLAGTFLRPPFLDRIAFRRI